MNKKAIYTLEFNKIQEQLVAKASSEGAKAILRKLKIETDINIINEKLDETNDALSRIFQKGSLDFSKVRDIRDSLLRLKMGSSLNTRELLNISDILTLSKQIKEYYEYKEDSLQPSIDALEEATSLNNQIKRCIISEDEIADEASATLSDIRRNKRLSSDKIHTELNRLLNSSSVRNCLQDFVITSRNGRYCLPVKAEYKSQVPGMVHDQSSTGSTLFIEPASVVKLNNDIKELELKEQAEIEVILAKLSASANEYQDVLLSDYELLTNLDVAFAKGNLSKQMKAARPTMNNNGIINIKKGRHPLIEQHVVVPIDIYLGRDFKLLIITGPNTGGKTVSLKTVGLLTLMAQAGLNIPALEHSDIAVFENVFADIGDEQSIEQSLSTFSSHMTNQVKILRHANEKSLVLFDEIGAGTDPTEGAALATSILNHLKNKNVTTMATTHYSELKMYALTTEGVENASCEFDVETLSPTYKLLIGVPGKSNAFAISKKLGLPEYILKDASKRLEEDDIKFEDLVTDLENTRAKLEREKEEITAYKAEIESLKEKLESKNERIDQSKDKILRRANEQAAAILQEAKDYADETIKVMNKTGMSVKELEKRRSDVRTKINKRNEKLKVEPAKLTKHTSSNIEDFKKGMYVRVLTMNVIGRITDIYPTKKQVNVLIGSLSTKMPIKNLEILENYKDPEESKANASKTSTGSSKIKMGKAAHVKTEINLLGYTVDEAISVLDKYLDDAYIAKIPQVRIVHGKGTGALRNGITAYLRGVPYIASFRLGNIGEGDAGVTIVDFK
ncbi:endonuclease MutS2 [Lachnospira pectinoschiza]|uniref:Endonuclease MutS2 n=1 Tax=Lachnospira pectinoschiza TaxID=28052 RepID=A0A1G9XQX3_9FIRM|nr:endonuclease MutS2 [Lachnospira pectinoschiza]SDM98911.1 DNA mismatch repair protein MutS2 [Lachnospira pectinoschiza]